MDIIFTKMLINLSQTVVVKQAPKQCITHYSPNEKQMVRRGEDMDSLECYDL